MNIYGLEIIQPKLDQPFLGSRRLGTEEINPSGDWTAYLPVKEMQNKYFETFNCTGFGTEHAIDTLMAFLFQDVFNYSARFIGICAGTNAGGNDPWKVAQSIKENGMIPDDILPFSSDLKNIDEYYSFKGANEAMCRTIGKKWISEYNFDVEWVFHGGSISQKNSLISSALKRSPVAASVAAWGQPDADGIYHQEFQPDNHWLCFIVGENEKAWKVFDTYEKEIKLYSKESDIAMALLYKISKKDTTQQTGTFQSIINWILQIIHNMTDSTQSETSKPIPVTITKKDIALDLFCRAIQTFEGYVAPGQKGRDGIVYPKGSLSYRNCNPGNLKSNNYPLEIGKDDKGFAIFKTYEDGWKTLQNYVKDAATGNSLIYRPTMMLWNDKALSTRQWIACSDGQKQAYEGAGNMPGFFNLYSTDKNEAKFVSDQIKASLSMKISEIMA